MLQQIKTNTFETKGKKEKCNKDRKYNKESNDVFGTKRYITEFIFFFKVPEGARYNQGDDIRKVTELDDRSKETDPA